MIDVDVWVRGRQDAITERVKGIGDDASSWTDEDVKKLLEGSKDIEKLAATHLLGLGLPIHMADMAVYLASDESAITTGQVISVDSGATIR